MRRGYTYRIHFTRAMAHKVKGFTTVYLMMILMTLVTSVVMMINAASGHAARSIVENVSATAGRSVLSEYQKDLYKRYGIFALRGDDALLSRLASFYINGSLVTLKAVVRPVAVKVQCSCEAHPALEAAAFGKQVRRLSPGAALTKGDLIKFFTERSKDAGSSGISVPTDKDAEEPDILKTAEKELGKDKSGSKGRSVSGMDKRRLPSKLLGYPKRVSLLLSGGIRDLSFAAAIEDEYMMAMCSHALRKKDGCYLEKEIEYILYGNDSDAANYKAVRFSIFAIRMAVNETKYVSESGEILISTAAALALSIAEVRTLLAGGKVDGLDYAMYLRVLLALLPRNEKLARLMDVMQLNIAKIDGGNFSFRNYAYGFDLNATFIMKKRLGDVEQEHIYR